RIRQAFSPTLSFRRYTMASTKICYSSAYSGLLSPANDVLDSLHVPDLSTTPGIVVLGGLPKIGQSFIALSMVRALAFGQPMFGCPDLQVEYPVRELILDGHNLEEAR